MYVGGNSFELDYFCYHLLMLLIWHWVMLKASSSTPRNCLGSVIKLSSPPEKANSVNLLPRCGEWGLLNRIPQCIILDFTGILSQISEAVTITWQLCLEKVVLLGMYGIPVILLVPVWQKVLLPIYHYCDITISPNQNSLTTECHLW